MDINSVSNKDQNSDNQSENENVESMEIEPDIDLNAELSGDDMDDATESDKNVVDTMNFNPCDVKAEPESEAQSEFKTAPYTNINDLDVNYNAIVPKSEPMPFIGFEPKAEPHSPPNHAGIKEELDWNSDNDLKDDPDYSADSKTKKSAKKGKLKHFTCETCNKGFSTKEKLQRH